MTNRDAFFFWGTLYFLVYLTCNSIGMFDSDVTSTLEIMANSTDPAVRKVGSVASMSILEHALFLIIVPFLIFLWCCCNECLLVLRAIAQNARRRRDARNAQNTDLPTHNPPPEVAAVWVPPADPAQMYPPPSPFDTPIEKKESA